MKIRMLIETKKNGFQITFKRGLKTISKQSFKRELMPTFLLSHGLANFQEQPLNEDALQRSLQILQENLLEVQGYSR